MKNVEENIANDFCKAPKYPSADQLQREKQLINIMEWELTEMFEQAANEDMSWRDQAECGKYDSQVYFSKDPDKILLAKKICQPCPVQQECLDYALQIDDIEGVWGGLDTRQIRQLQIQNERKPLKEQGQEQTEKEQDYQLLMTEHMRQYRQSRDEIDERGRLRRQKNYQTLF